MSGDYYDGTAVYVGEDQEAPDGTPLQGGWHYAVVTDEDGTEHIGDRLHLEDTEDGSKARFRLATDDDTRSWHDRKHRQYVITAMEDGQAGIGVTPEELEAVKEFLDQRRGG